MISQKQRWILSILGILVVVVWVRGLTAPPTRSRRPAPLAQVSRPAPVPDSTTPSSRKVISDAPWGVNPFLEERQAATPAETGKQYGPVLGGVLWDPKTPSAVVNGRVVTVGEHVGKWTVVEIRRDRVILSDGDAQETLWVK